MLSHDPVYYLRSPGRHLGEVERQLDLSFLITYTVIPFGGSSTDASLFVSLSWGDLMSQLGPEATAYWPNYPVKLPREVEYVPF